MVQVFASVFQPIFCVLRLAEQARLRRLGRANFDNRHPEIVFRTLTLHPLGAGGKTVLIFTNYPFS
jgi:hypothetical protein